MASFSASLCNTSSGTCIQAVDVKSLSGRVQGHDVWQQHQHLTSPPAVKKPDAMGWAARKHESSILPSCTDAQHPHKLAMLTPRPAQPGRHLLADEPLRCLLRCDHHLARSPRRSRCGLTMTVKAAPWPSNAGRPAIGRRRPSLLCAALLSGPPACRGRRGLLWRHACPRRWAAEDASGRRQGRGSGGQQKSDGPMKRRGNAGGASLVAAIVASR